MSQYLESLLCDVFRAQGASDPEGLAHKAAQELDIDKRDTRIYEMRAHHSEKETSERFGLTVRRIRQIVHDQTVLRRKSKTR